MEKIRLRRLEKLGSSKPATDTTNQTPESPAGPSSPSQSSTQNTAGDSMAPANPFSRLGLKPATPSSTSTTPQDGPNSNKRRIPSDVEAVDSRKPPARKLNVLAPLSLEDFSDRVLTDILHATVDPTKASDQIIFLPELSQALKDVDEPLKLSLDNIDAAIMEAASSWPRDKSLLSYFLPCWSRAQEQKRAPPRDATEDKLNVLSEAKRLCISNCLFAVTVPDLFGRETVPENHGLVPHLLKESALPEGIDEEFLREAVSRFEDEETLPEVFTQAMLTISQRLASMTMEMDFQPYVRAMLLYCRVPALLDLLARHPSFQMAQSARGIETHTILGPFFKLSPVSRESALTFFPSPRTMDKNSIILSQDSMRQCLANHQSDLITITNSFVRASPATRGRTLDWFAYIMNTNHKRRAMRVNLKEVASDGFMLNVTRVLDRLSEPFMDTSFSKMDRINVDYFRQSPRLDIKEETKINADQAASDAFYESKAPGSPHFISEVFFLNLASHHYGLEACVARIKSLEREIGFYEKHVATMEAERPKVMNNPMQLQLFDAAVKKHTDTLESAMRTKFGLEGVLEDPKMQEVSLRFMRYVAVWLLRVASNTDYTPDKTLQLPLPEQQPAAFACLPEYALQNVVDNFKFAYRYLPRILPLAVGDEMISLCIAFLQCSDYIKNPYLKSSLVSLLFSGTWPMPNNRNGVLGDQLTNSKFANDHLLHALMKFYIECESTGAHNQFFDKFNIRYEIFQVVKCVWRGNEVYSRQLTRESKINRPFFIQFVNLLLNDATYVLDEAMGKFPKIHVLEAELRGNLSQEDKQAKQEEMQQLAGAATSYMRLANETMEMMKLFTKALRDAFTMPEIVQRLASMLNYNVETLAGPKARELKVDNPEKYHFRPASLLSDLIDIYIHLGSSQDFINSVATDGRSYHPATFEKASVIMQTKTTKDPAEVRSWDKLREKFLEAKLEADQAELDLGEIPAEFEDPILGDLMRDPVILPSRHVVDRSTIVQHLLSDPKDPFTRQPMTIDDAVPDHELRAKIDAWREEKMNAAKAKAKEEVEREAAEEARDTLGAGAGGDDMDTTEG
ncbi:related to ubiquitin fusion degradation protein 2 [Cephalotrichum gorgonifer]|uniref:Related to ubiquitin fusion degradation protein 2 n=1 Tax=Cephalotrichum gorgonifer TaxID=2041049 RepID=A0AAE8SW12_9PEZI|nr:related to ubiquitin fusion degradation protein 2 [Cephalotrichum gorgonifer]